jgi:phosphoribosylformylglycinamidine cyclo-ligase
MKKLTYKSAGVDIDKANVFITRINSLIKSTNRKEVFRTISGFGGVFRFLKDNYKEPLLVSSTDGVGTKLKIAQDFNRHLTVGIDLVAMNVNDILCIGAEPLFFLDYIACGRLNPEVLVDVTRGIVNGCRQAGCALIGGETAEMPGMYKKTEYDLAGFVVGVVEKNKIVDGSNIKCGDKIIGLASNGLHSNGFSLVRKVFSKSEIKKYYRELLKPTRIYVRPILSLLSIHYSLVKGIAHITGGAYYEKIPKILPLGLAISINKSSWRVPKIFKLIQERGRLSDFEMFRTFNMGIGMVLIVSPTDVSRLRSILAKNKLRSWVIGEVIRGKKNTIIR